MTVHPTNTGLFPLMHSDITNLSPQSSHIHLIDALMMAYAVEMISIEKVVTSVKRFANFSASKELPYDLEEAMVFWINKVITKHTFFWVVFFYFCALQLVLQ